MAEDPKLTNATLADETIAATDNEEKGSATSIDDSTAQKYPNNSKQC